MNNDEEVLPYSPQAIRPRRFSLFWLAAAGAALAFSTQDLGPEIACCPSTGKPFPTTQPSPTWFNLSSDYTYLGAGLDQNAPADVIVAHDRLGNHFDEGEINVLFADGRTDHIELGNFPAALTASNQSRAKWQASRENRASRPATRAK